MNRLTVEECEKISIFQLDSEELKASVMTLNDQVVHFSYSQCNYGGMRFWFLCPSCNKQVGTLYRKPLGTLFFCRSCHRLTYQLTRYRRSAFEQVIKNLHQNKKSKLI